MAGVSRPDSISSLTGFPPAVKNVPANWPTRPTPDKISLLFNYNSQDIYRKFNPYTTGDNPFGIIPNKQPFVYRYPDEAQNSFFNKLPSSVKTLANIVRVNQSSVDDMYRVSKFLLTSQGIQFLATQTFLQAYQPFPETSVYNPLETIVATVQPIGQGLIDLPKRYLDIDDPLSAIGISSNSIIGRLTSPINTGISNLLGRIGIGTQPKPNQLPTFNTGQKAGLIRIPTGNRAKSTLDSTWGSGTLVDTLGSQIRALVDPLIPTFIPRKSPDTSYRQDERTYDAMIDDKIGRLTYFDRFGAQYSAVEEMVWRGSLVKSVFKDRAYFLPTGVNLNQNSGRSFSRITSFKNGKSINGKPTGYSVGGGLSVSDVLGFNPFGAGGTIGGLAVGVAGNVLSGFLPDSLTGLLGISSGVTKNPPVKYGDFVGVSSSDKDSLKNSDMLVNFAEFLSDDGTRQLEKLSNESAPKGYQVQEINRNLQEVIKKIGKSGVYVTSIAAGSQLISSGQTTSPRTDGYGKIDAQTDPQNGYKAGIKNSYGIGAQYFADVQPGTNNKTPTAKPTDNVFGTRNLRFATSFASDGINLLPVLRGDRKIVQDAALSALYPGWTEWSPEHDDLVAFYFYDVVNNKYIPFRATVKGISEGNTAFWDELRFIGRADQLYSYNGFSRTLSFTFNVVINSITELLPTYKKLNYLAGVVKPSNYTKSDTFGGRYSNFIVPPMFMITIGDLYKYQPMVVTSININIPDDAAWETQNEINATDGWNYLTGIIKSPLVGKKYAQLPKEFEVAITANLLEKERAIVGAAHFGHAPHRDSYQDGVFNTGNTISNEPVEFLPEPTEFSKEMIEFNAIGGEDSTSKPQGTTGVTSTSSPIVSNASFSPNNTSTPSVPPTPTATPTATGISNASGKGRPFTIPGTSVTGIDFSR